MSNSHRSFSHPQVTRRMALQVGSIGLLGMGMNHLHALRAEASGESHKFQTAKSCIFIFLSGGLSQHESFDLKPEAPDGVRGEFQPISTKTPGLQISEHLPLLAQRSNIWSICRSLTHPYNEHSQGHHVMLTGQTAMPRGFNPSKPQRTDHPSIAALMGNVLKSTTNLPPAIVLPEKLVHSTGRVIPGQFAGKLGANNDPWFIESSSAHRSSYGAYPEYSFDPQQRGHKDNRVFQTPNFKIPQGLTLSRVNNRLHLLGELRKQSRLMELSAEVESYDRYRNAAISLLNDKDVHHALDVVNADEKIQERYGKNSFGWSLLMARRLVDVGVNLVQVNLGNDETWDNHGDIFPNMKDKLLPPTDKAVSALLDDLSESGQLDETLVVMCSEFGRTPKISHLRKFYAKPGRDHWGGVQSVFFAGGGIKGGRVIGATDSKAAFPTESPQRPENFAATIYRALGLPQSVTWHDEVDRPNFVYQGDPIPGLI